MSETIRIMYQLVLLDGARLKSFVLHWYSMQAEMRRQDKSIVLDLPDAVCFIEAYGSGK